MNTNSGFSPERGFFRAADKGAGGGGEGKDGEKGKKINEGFISKPENQAINGELLTSNIDQIHKNILEIEDILTGNSTESFLKVYNLIDSSIKLINDNIDDAQGRELSALQLFGLKLEEKARDLRYQIEGVSQTQSEEKSSDSQSSNKDKDVKDGKESASSLISLIEDNLKSLEGKVFSFSEDQDQVAEAFEESKEILSDLKRNEEVDKELVKNKEIELLICEYKKRREALLRTLTNMEKTQSLGENSFTRAIENPGLGEMKNIVSNLEKLGLENVEEYIDDLEGITKHYDSRKFLLLTWIHVRTKIFDGSGENGARTSFGQVGEQEFPISGEHFQELILEGINFNPDFGNPLNHQFTSTNRIVKNFIEKGSQQTPDFDKKMENKEVNETLFTFCMQEFDNIYKNGTGTEDPEDKEKTIEEITTRNLREKQGALIDFVFKKAKKEMPELEKKIDEHAIELAFRTHTILTMHHSRFASGSPSLKDDWYYAFRFPEYVVKYAKYGVDKFDPYLTFLLFGTRPGLKQSDRRSSEDEATDENILATMFSKARVNRVMRMLKNKGLWNEGKRGLRNFDGLVKGYAILLEDVSPNFIPTKDFIQNQVEADFETTHPGLSGREFDRQVKEETEKRYKEEIKKIKSVIQNQVEADFKTTHPGLSGTEFDRQVKEEIQKRYKEIERANKPDYSFLAPPLRYLRQKDKKGNFLRHMAPQGREGKHVLLDDLIDEKGNIAYGLINYEGIGNDLMAYYNSMNQHGIDNFLNRFVKADRFEFMKNAESASSLKSLKNEARYTASLLPRVGIYSLMKLEDVTKKDGLVDPLDNAIMDRILIQVIFINCILHTSLAATDEVFWNDRRVQKYLVDLVSENVISIEEQEAIGLAIKEFRGDALMIEGLKRGVTEQIKKANIYK